MILQALNEYYDRKVEDSNSDIAPPNWVIRGLDYVVLLNEEGAFQQLEPLYEFNKAKRIARSCLVPSVGKQSLKHTNSGTDANLLWDNAAFVFGIGKKGNIKQKSFVDRIKLWFPKSEDQGIAAVLSFLEKGVSNADFFKPILTHLEFGEDIRSGRPNLSFRLAGDKSLFVFDRPEIKRRITAGVTMTAESQPNLQTCLVTGQSSVIEDCHFVIKGVWGAQPAGAPLVGFNAEAFCSFHKAQGRNAPVSKRAAFAYTTVLNRLLAKDSKQRMQVGDASTVFWSQSETTFESQMADFFSEPRKDDPDRGVRAVESLFKAIETGTLAEQGSAEKFYVLGLAPNASRIAVRFWIVDTVDGMAKKIRQHFEDLKITHGPRDKDVFSLFRLLVNTAVQGKSENIPQNLAGDAMRSILEGSPYPATLLQAAVRRIRAEHEINYIRAAIIKACINRSTRFRSTTIKEELKVTLDIANGNTGYLLGRLFAALEKIQQEASPGLNATIRDKFYAAASGTPVTVFGNLMRLKNHHLAKLEYAGRRVYFEKLIGQILSGVSDFPAHLRLEDQGRFAIGYYHQMQDFFTKKSDKPE